MNKIHSMVNNKASIFKMDFGRDKIKKRFITLTVSATVAVLAGCGGGGGSSTPSTGKITSTLTFPLANAMANSITTSQAYTFTYQTITGTSPITTLTGTLNMSAAVGVTFEGQAALEQIGTIETNGTSGFSSNYYTTNYLNVGSMSNSDYCVTQGGGFAFPVSVKVGDQGDLGTSQCFTDSTKSTPNGTQAFSYTVEADTASTAIFNFITMKTQQFAPGVSFTRTSEGRNRIDEFGNAPIALSDTVTDSSSVNLVTYTPI